MGFDFTKQGNFNSRFPDDGLTCAVILKKKNSWPDNQRFKFSFHKRTYLGNC